MPTHFISYSRQELTFTDSLSRRLDQSGHDIWLDFRRLVPGRSWQDQLYEAIQNATTILLVVSSDSMTSPAVYDEWTTAIQNGKRIILIIFEAVELKPTEKLRKRCDDAIVQGWAAENVTKLAGDGCTYGWEALNKCEWVDFRGPFSKAIQQLEIVLKSSPGSPAYPPPQSGFAMPPIPSIALYLSWITAFMSIPTVIPAIRLVPLPRKIKNRTHQYSLITLHIVGLIALWFVLGVSLFSILNLAGSFVRDAIIYIWLGLTLLPAALLGLMTYEPGMYRWAGPGGAPVPSMIRQVPLILRPYIPVAVILVALGMFFLSPQPALCYGLVILYWIVRAVVLRGWVRSVSQPQPVRFTLDYASADETIADEIIRKLQQAGHRYVRSFEEESDCTLVLLSRFKKGTRLALQEVDRNIYPVLVDDVNPDRFDKDLSQRQWIDLRRAVPMKIGLLARIIHDPQLINQYLAVPPARHIKRSWIVDFTIVTLILLLISQVMRILGVVGSVWSVLRNPQYAVNWGAVCVPLALPCIVLFFCYPLVKGVHDREITYRSFMKVAIPSAFFGYFGPASVYAAFMSLVWIIMFVIILLNGKALKLWLPANV